MSDPITLAQSLGLVGVPPGKPADEAAAREYTEHVQLLVFALTFHNYINTRITGGNTDVLFATDAEEAAFDAACRRLGRAFCEGIRS